METIPIIRVLIVQVKNVTSDGESIYLVFLHLTSNSVNEGDIIGEGDVIGASGEQV